MEQEIIESMRKGSVGAISTVERAIAILFFGLPIVGEMFMTSMQHDHDAAMADEGGAPSHGSAH